MPLIHVEDDAHFKKILADNADGVVIIDFTASWCGPCKMISPVFEELAEQHPNVPFLKVDVDECTEAAGDVNAMPTFRVIKNGKKVKEFSGANADELKAMVQAHVA
ncbi:unnamed protein product, partial [Mesorhabditis spiculigera]